MILNNKIYMMVICDNDTYLTNQVYTSKCDQFRIYSQWNTYVIVWRFAGRASQYIFLSN